MADITALLFTNNTVYAKEWPRHYENKDYLSYYATAANLISHFSTYFCFGFNKLITKVFLGQK